MALEPPASFYWGDIDTSHQFCEAAYAVTPVCAEFWNAISNLPSFVIPCSLGFLRCYSTHDSRILQIWLLGILVACGSILFHGTMRLPFQMLDEIPMFLLVLAGARAKADTHWVMRGRWKLLVDLVMRGGSVTGLCIYVITLNYEVFLHTFGIILVLEMILSGVCAWETGKHGSQAAWFCWIWSVTFIIVGRIAWETEFRLCPSGSGGPLAWLHVVFHVCIGVACYFGALMNTQIRYEAFGFGSAIDEPGQSWPLVRLMIPARVLSPLKKLD
eukprot:TRINITY_DN17161_c0_g1_i1.p1 TRINITY_DN17161_c0_g1~~TRINITY_DN17161_c0_g1_i1.p1  ORF type:complete len:272 (+),score=27.55 TRINITY_DN17161_c0_g1_i1:34-849(+)